MYNKFAFLIHATGYGNVLKSNTFHAHKPHAFAWKPQPRALPQRAAQFHQASTYPHHKDTHMRVDGRSEAPVHGSESRLLLPWRCPQAEGHHALLQLIDAVEKRPDLVQVLRRGLAVDCAQERGEGTHDVHSRKLYPNTV